MFEKGTKRGLDFEQKRGSKGDQKVDPRLKLFKKFKRAYMFKFSWKLNLDEGKTMFLFLLSFKRTDFNLNNNSSLNRSNR